MDRTQAMRYQKINSLLWSFSLPAIVGMVVNSLYNIVDRIFLGRGIGSLAIAATTVAFPIMIILMAVSVLIGVGATALISIRLGEQRQEEAEKVIGTATTMIILLPTIFAFIFFLYTEPILIAFGASPEVLPYARDFMQVIMLGAVFGTISMGMNNFIRAEGNPRMAMYTQLLGGAVNVVLNYVFIFQFGWGMRGSAFATVLGQVAGATWVLSYFLSGRSIVKIRWKNLRPRLPILLSIMAIGFAPFAMQVANSVQHMILNKTVIYYSGDIALSAVGIMMSIGTILFMPILGLSQGAQPIIGFNYGARQFGRVKETFKVAVFAGTAISVLGWLVVHIWPAQLIALFNPKDAELIALTTHAMIIYFAMLPVLGFQIIGSTYFQAVGKPVQSTILSLSRQVLIFIPLLLILPRFWGIEGVWRTPPISDLLAVLLTATFIFFEMKKINEMGKREKAWGDEGDLAGACTDTP
ncbi:MAG TPA: MATE family efflux transporter [Syntrophomonas sp.]|jgi:putative MATE family efflux protein|nr:MATE family efflux transporter [Syntrophomonas sp.]